MWSKPSAPPSQAHPAASPLAPQAIKQKNPGRRFAQVVKLRPDCVDKYKEVHAAVWPEVLKQIKNCNIQDCEDYLNYPLPYYPLSPAAEGFGGAP